MKLKVQEFEDFSTDKGYANGFYLLLELGGGIEAYDVIRQGKCGLGYEMARKIFNTYGQAVTERLIDFEKDTIEGFKSKYLLVGKTLAGVTDMDEKDDEYLISGDSDFIYLLTYGKPKRKIFPNWYFTWQHYSIRKWKFISWKRRSGMSWRQINEELGLNHRTLKNKLNSIGGWTMVDMICLCDLMGTRELFIPTFVLELIYMVSLANILYICFFDLRMQMRLPFYFWPVVRQEPVWGFSFRRQIVLIKKRIRRCYNLSIKCLFFFRTDM